LRRGRTCIGLLSPPEKWMFLLRRGDYIPPVPVMFDFTKLPAEIRIMIYKYCLKLPGSTHLTRPGVGNLIKGGPAPAKDRIFRIWTWCPDNLALWRYRDDPLTYTYCQLDSAVLSILKLSRHVTCEASCEFYKINTFEIEDVGVREFLLQIGDRRNLIQNLRILTTSARPLGTGWQTWKYVRACQGLKHLTFDAKTDQRVTEQNYGRLWPKVSGPSPAWATAVSPYLYALKSVSFIINRTEPTPNHLRDLCQAWTAPAPHCTHGLRCEFDWCRPRELCSVGEATHWTYHCSVNRRPGASTSMPAPSSCTSVSVNHELLRSALPEVAVADAPRSATAETDITTTAKRSATRKRTRSRAELSSPDQDAGPPIRRRTIR